MIKLAFTDFDDSDWPHVWRIFEPICREGASYPLAYDVSETAAREYWTGAPKKVVVAHAGSETVGSYYIRADQGGPGDHVCNCGYIVSSGFRRRGVGEALCRHSQDFARRMGFTAMKYNLVVATNLGAVRTWEKCGLKIIGTARGAFRHKALGLVDAHIMYIKL